MVLPIYCLYACTYSIPFYIGILVSSRKVKDDLINYNSKWRSIYLLKDTCHCTPLEYSSRQLQCSHRALALESSRCKHAVGDACWVWVSCKGSLHANLNFLLSLASYRDVPVVCATEVTIVY
jgi:hypothetical protein